MDEPKILFYDVETTYLKCNLWRTGQQFVDVSAIDGSSITDIICIAYKFQGEKQVHTLDWGVRKQNSQPMIDTFSKVAASADLVIAHNGDSFDLKMINTLRVLHNKPPILWPSTQDTLKALRKHFRFPSNKLDYVARVLFGQGKNPMVKKDWEDIIERKNPDALAKMIKYNVKDVLLLEKLFKRLRPWMTPKKIKPLVEGECPSCFSKKSRSNGRRLVRGKFHQRRVCLACGHVYIGPKIEEEE